MLVGRINDLGNVQDRVAVDIFRALIRAVDGNLELTQNLRAKIVKNVKFDKANFDTQVVHGLGKATRNFLIIGSNQFAHFRWGRNLPDSDRLWVACDTADVIADILVFI